MKKITESAKIKKVIASTDLSEVNEAMTPNDIRVIIKEITPLLRPIIEAGDKLSKLWYELYPGNSNFEQTLKEIQAELLSITNKNPYHQISKYVK